MVQASQGALKSMPTELPRGRVVVKELLKPADKSVSHPVVAATDDGTTRKETASGSNIGPMRDRDVWSSPVWIMGGAVALLTTGTMQSRRERRREILVVYVTLFPRLQGFACLLRLRVAKLRCSNWSFKLYNR